MEEMEHTEETVNAGVWSTHSITESGIEGMKMSKWVRNVGFATRSIPEGVRGSKWQPIFLYVPGMRGDYSR